MLGPGLKAAIAGCGSPRYSYKGIAALLGLGQWADDRAVAARLAALGAVVLVRNTGGQFIDADYNVRHLTRLAGGGHYRLFVIPASPRLEHDLVTPERSAANWPRIRASYHYLYLEGAVGVARPDSMAGADPSVVTETPARRSAPASLVVEKRH